MNALTTLLYHMLLSPTLRTLQQPRNEVDVPEELQRQLHANMETVVVGCTSHTDFLVSEKDKRTSIQEEDETVKLMKEILSKLQSRPPNFSLRVKNGSYKITNYHEEDPATAATTQATTGGRAKQKIATVRSESPLFKLQKFIVKCLKGELKPYKEQVTIMDQINLALEPGKMYLVLGAPGSGKSSLLKLISNTLYTSRDHVVEGQVSVAGVSPGQGIYWSNVVSYIDQIDRIHPYMTVQEVCEFSWRCGTGSTHRRPFHGEGADVDATIEEMDQEMTIVNNVLRVLGLTRVKDTFVGDQSTVRGVSGGEKKRVTLAEMLVVR